MSGDSIRWAEVPEDERREDGDDTEAHGASVDDTFAARRLRRWLRGMFGGEDDSTDEPSDRDRD